MLTILNKLMTKNLEYKNYLAQGGDWGATIANWIGYDHSKSCKAIHINCLTMRHPDGPHYQSQKSTNGKIDLIKTRLCKMVIELSRQQNLKL